MKLGFIGTGKITTSVIEGLIRSKVNCKQILISQRNRKNSSYLKRKSKKIKVSKSNQEIINKSSIVFISLLPKIAIKELTKLKFNKNHKIVSFVSTLNLTKLKKLCNPAKQIIKAGPLPMASDNLSPTILYPKDKVIANLFNKIGTVVEAKNEKQNNHLWVMTSLMASYIALIKSFNNYLVKNKIKSTESKKYLNTFLTGMLFQLNNNSFNFDKIIKDLQTKGGINEELLKRLQKDKFFTNLQKNLNKIYFRLKKANDK